MGKKRPLFKSAPKPVFTFNSQCRHKVRFTARDAQRASLSASGSAFTSACGAAVSTSLVRESEEATG